MKRNGLISVVLLFLLCFIFAQPLAAAEETSEDSEVSDDWIVIYYLADETVTVKIHAGSAIANLWEPETVGGSKFLYWTYNDDWYSLEGNRRQITKETVFYESEFLRAVTEDTDDELKEMKEFAENWTGEPTEQETEAERDYYIVKFHDCDENGTTWDVEAAPNKSLGKERLSELTEDFAVRKGYHFVGWYTERNGGGKEFTGKTKVKSDMDVYAYWIDDGCYTVTFMKNYGKGEQFVEEMNVEESKAKFTSGPKVSRKGYRITGWYTKPKGGKKVKIGSKLTSDITLYAHWEKVKVKKVSIKQLYGKDKAITVRYKKQAKVDGYQVQVSTSKTFAKKNTITKTYNNNNVFKRSIKKLKKGQTYYLRIRAYKKDSAGRKVYGKWSEVKQIKTK